MKSSLRFALLFALIIIGKVTKQSTTVKSTVKVLQHNNSLAVPTSSFFTRQGAVSATTVGSGRLWHTSSKAEQQVQFE